MDCSSASAKLNETLDQALEPAEARGLEEHLRLCPDCRARQNLLEAAFRAIAALAHDTPSPAFSDQVLRRLGLAPEPFCAALWEKWAVAGLGSVVSFCSAGLLWLAWAKFSLHEAARVAELCAARLALLLAQAPSVLRHLGRVQAPEAAGLPLQLAAASLIAALFLFAACAKAPAAASQRTWRSL